MDYEALETELVGALNSYFGANVVTGGTYLLNTVFGARTMPENQQELLQDYSLSMVNVQYADSVYDQAESNSSMSQVVQDEVVKVVCYMQANTMRGPAGGYQLIDSVKRALLGYKPVNASVRMWISNYGDWRIEDGQLNPYLEFSFRTLSMQVFDDSDPATGGAFVAETGDVYANGVGPIS